jgi:hypothetical protein
MLIFLPGGSFAAGVEGLAAFSAFVSLAGFVSEAGLAGEIPHIF